MYVAGYMVTGFVVAGAYASGRLRGRWGRYERTALAIPLRSPSSLRSRRRRSATGRLATSRPTSRPSSPRSRGSARRPRAHRAPARLVRRTARSSTGSRSRTCSRCSRSTAERDGAGPRHACPPTLGRRSMWCASPSRSMVGIGTLLALLGLFYLAVRLRRGGCPSRRGSTARWWCRAVVARRADRRLGRRPRSAASRGSSTT